MNYQRPDLRNKLAAEYVLGTLQGGARRRFESLLDHDLELRALVEAWTERLIPVGIPSEDLVPSEMVWRSISQRLDGPGSSANRQPAWMRRLQSLFPQGPLGASMAGTALGIAIGVAGMLLLVPGQRGDELIPRGGDRTSPTQPPVPTEGQLPDSYIVVISGTGGKPALLATAPRSGRILRVSVLQGFTIEAEEVPVLWSISIGRAPNSLGALSAEGVTELDLSRVSEDAFAEVEELAVSIEPRSAHPLDAPTGGYAMRGQLLKTW